MIYTDVSEEEKAAKLFAKEFDQFSISSKAKAMSASWNYASNLTQENANILQALTEEMDKDLKVKICTIIRQCAGRSAVVATLNERLLFVAISGTHPKNYVVQPHDIQGSSVTSSVRNYETPGLQYIAVQKVYKTYRSDK